MNPRPLMLDGKVHAYACGRCGFVRYGSWHGGPWDTSDVEQTRRDAARCCACHECGAPLSPDRHTASFSCDACQLASRVKVETAHVEAVRSWEDAEKNHERAWSFTLEDGRTGTVYVVEDRAIFFAAWARLDPTADDPTPRAECELLNRDDNAVVMEVLAHVCRAYGQAVTGLRERVTHDAKGDKEPDDGFPPTLKMLRADFNALEEELALIASEWERLSSDEGQEAVRRVAPKLVASIKGLVANGRKGWVEAAMQRRGQR